MSIDKIEVAKEKFGKLIEEQLARVERMKADKDFIDYASLAAVKIGNCGGDELSVLNYCSGSEKGYGSGRANKLAACPSGCRLRMIWRLHQRNSKQKSIGNSRRRCS